MAETRTTSQARPRATGKAARKGGLVGEGQRVPPAGRLRPRRAGRAAHAPAAPGPKPLRGVSAIRAFFRRNKTPIYFVSPTSFNLLGVDRWISNFTYVNYYDSFGGTHPRVFVPEDKGDDNFSSMEEMNNYLLAHPEFYDLVQEKGPGGKAVLVMFDEETERLAGELGIQVALPSAELRHRMDSKLVTTRMGNEAGVPSVPNVLGTVDDYDGLVELAHSAGLGDDLVVQLPWGDSGKTTFFISDRDGWDAAAENHELTGVELKVMKRINCRAVAVEAVLTRHGTLVGPIMADITGYAELTPYKGGWAGNDVYLDVLTDDQRARARVLTQNLGARLATEGYRGFFEVDYLVDTDTGELYLGEINPRLSGISSMTNVTAGAYAELPLFLFHLLEYLDVDYMIDVDEINDRWADPDSVDVWSQVVIKQTDDRHRTDHRLAADRDLAQRAARQAHASSGRPPTGTTCRPRTRASTCGSPDPVTTSTRAPTSASWSAGDGCSPTTSGSPRCAGAGSTGSGRRSPPPRWTSCRPARRRPRSRRDTLAAGRCRLRHCRSVSTSSCGPPAEEVLRWRSNTIPADVHEKGLSGGSVGLLGSVTLGVSSVAPAYTLTATLGLVVAAVGLKMPAIFIAGFVPMFLTAYAYRELNRAIPDCGTSFTWATKAFGTYTGWMCGWGLIVATVIVLSNLAGVAVVVLLPVHRPAHRLRRDRRAGRQQAGQHRHLPGLHRGGHVHRLPRDHHHRAGAGGAGRLPDAGAGAVHRGRDRRVGGLGDRNRVQLGVVQPVHRSDARPRSWPG